MRPPNSKAATDWLRQACELAAQCDYDSSKLAKRLGVGRRQLHRLFTERVAQSPQRWLNERRLIEARRRLARAESVKEVAFALHFRTQAHFSSAFKRRFGKCPSELMPSRNDDA